MTSDTHQQSAPTRPLESDAAASAGVHQIRRSTRWAGILFFVTHVTSVGAVALYSSGGFDTTKPLRGRTAVLQGGLLEVMLAAAVVGTSVALYPALRRRSHGLASAYVALRTLEASVILAGVVAILPVVARPATTAAAGIDPAVGAGLRLLHDWTFLIGPGLINPINTVVLAWLLLKSRAVPRPIPMLGLVGAVLIGSVNVIVMFGQINPQPVAAVPIFLWEISLAIYLIARGLTDGQSGSRHVDSGSPIPRPAESIPA